MVIRIRPVSSLMGGPDGPGHLRQTSGVWSSTAFYCHLLRIHLPDALFRDEGAFAPVH